MRASLKNARISPKKMNLVAGLVRGKMATEALDQLRFTPKKGAQILAKVITSAVANATNNRAQDAEKLVIKSIIVNKGVTYKRGIAVSRGRYHPILKRNTNLSVEVAVIETKETDTHKSSQKASAPSAEVKTPEETTTEIKATAKKPAAKKTVSKKKPVTRNQEL
ncbi:MAG: 50S ribosomal protein L22 [Candidatus Gracilibacteria bacterium]|nr:50S ribosomal protein L22 [bacterium]MDZ4217063.1 50S ribosomal protein L22 [Candidatus Gracilibacteria bacterium]